jgi:hypothetical protein
MTPPLPVRRLVIAPLVVLAELAIAIASPVALLVAALASPVFGGWQPVRMVLIVQAFALGHLGAVAGCLALWQRRGAQHDHYEVMRTFVSRVYGAIVRIARVELRPRPPRRARRARPRARRTAGRARTPPPSRRAQRAREAGPPGAAP